MYPDIPDPPSRGSFLRPVPMPTVDPDASPTRTISINCQWLPYIRGALQQLLLQATWQENDIPSLLLLTQQRVFNLIDLFQECSESVLPLACPYDFNAAADQLGWNIIDCGTDFPGGTIGTWNGLEFESKSNTLTGGPFHYQQIQIWFPVFRFVSTVAVEITSTTENDVCVLADTGADCAGSSPLVGCTTITSPGIRAVAVVTVDQNIDYMRIVATNHDISGADNSSFTLPALAINILEHDPTCP